jgi:putative zinc finger protein
MARAPLRPVPGQPAEPVTDAAAVTLVAAALPALAEPDRTALALVALAGMPRGQVALRLGREEAELSEALTRARKELRRTVASLGGSGWCERSERMISDRIDGALADADVRRLDVHLRNCPRCVEHERRLVQATDALVASATGVPYGFPSSPAQPVAAAKRSAATAAEGDDAPARSELLSALPLKALIAFTVLLALAAIVLAAIALGLQV